MQRSVASASKRTTVRFAELKQRRYYFPLTVVIIPRNYSFHLPPFTFNSALEFKSFKSNCLRLVDVLQVGIGLLILQQLSGINGVVFYSSTIFESAGKRKLFPYLMLEFL